MHIYYHKLNIMIENVIRLNFPDYSTLICAVDNCCIVLMMTHSRVLRSVQNGEGRGGGEGARLKARVQYSDMVIWLGLLLVFKLYKIQYLIAIHGKHKCIFIDNNYGSITFCW